MKTILLLTLLITISSCGSDDDGSTTTGNTQEYFKYTVDGVERIFDYEVELHLETETGNAIDRLEINASGLYQDGSLRHIAGNFFSPNTQFLQSNTACNWGFSNGTSHNFMFAENTLNHLFLINNDFLLHPIVANVSNTPTAIGDYIEFSFAGTYTDNNNAIHTISGLGRAQRDINQNF